MIERTWRRSSVSARSRCISEGRKCLGDVPCTAGEYVCGCISTLARGKGEREIRFTVQTRAAALWLASHGLHRRSPSSVLRFARKNLSAKRGAWLRGREPSPLVPFGASPYFSCTSSPLSISLSHFNSALSHRLRGLPFLHRSFIIRLLPITGVTISRLSDSPRWRNDTSHLISRLFLPAYVLIRFALCLLFFFIYSSCMQCSKKLA